MQRDEFVAALISALEENEKHKQLQVACREADADEFSDFFSMTRALGSQSPFGRIQRVYDALQFDYPQISESQLMRLAEFFQHGCSPTPTAGRSEQESLLLNRYPITNKLVESLDFLNDHPIGSMAASHKETEPACSKSNSSEMKTARSPKAAAFLAGSILLTHLARVLQLHNDQSLATALEGISVPEKSEAKQPSNGVNDAASTEFANDFGTKQLASALSAPDENPDVEMNELLEEVYALEEDPDDLSLVYEGDLPCKRPSRFSTSESAPLPTLPTRTQDQKGVIQQKLLFLSQTTNSSLFSSISPEEWQHWRFTSSIKSIVMFWLQNQHRFQPSTPGRQHQTDNSMNTSPYTRYLYLLRDRIMLFPTQSAPILQQLIELITWLQSQLKSSRAISSNGANHFGSGIGVCANTNLQRAESDLWGCLLVVYSILAEFCVSKHFATNCIADKHLVAAIEMLLPTLSWQLHSFTTKHTQCPRGSAAMEDERHDQDQEDDLLLLFLLQMSLFFVRFHANPRLAVQKLQEMGILRSFLMILFANPLMKRLIESSSRATLNTVVKSSPLTLAEPEAEQNVGTTMPLWCSNLLRLFTQCCLVYEEFTTFLSRVPKMHLVFAHEELCAQFSHEKVLWLVALQLHGASSQEDRQQLAHLLKRLFPLECDTVTGAKQIANQALYVMQSLNQSQVMQRLVPGKPSSFGTFLLQQVEICYGKLGSAFTCASPDADLKATIDQSGDHDTEQENGSIGDESRELHQQPDPTRQLVALRDDLRKVMKPLVAARKNSAPFHDTKLD